MRNGYLAGYGESQLNQDFEKNESRENFVMEGG